MNTVFVYPNKQKIGIHEAVVETCRLLKRFGAQVVLPRSCTCKEYPDVIFMEPDSAVRISNFVVVLGGDGTMLRIARLAAIYEVPIVGVNLGHVGFMTELERDEIEMLAGLFQDSYTIDSRMMLQLRVMRDEKCIYRADALNDVTISKTNPFHVIELRIAADNIPVTSFHGDGLIIATPTGTTAYSLAAGGPIVEPCAENVIVTPVCAHALQAKSFVFAPERIITVTQTDSRELFACVSADGDSGIDLRQGDIVSVEKSNKYTRLVRLKGKSFYQILRQKLSAGRESV